jgi:hypothetical protein
MKHYFSLIEYALWISITFLQFAACWALTRKRDFYNSWKVFRYYLFYMTGQSIVMLALSFLVSPTSAYYAISFYLGDFVEAVLINLVVLEILVKVLDPFESLPGRTIARFCFWAVLGISTAVALSVMVPAQHTVVLIDLPLAIERTIFLADASLLGILLVQSKALGLTWKSAEAEIAIGFVVYLTVQATSKFVVGMYKDPMLRSVSGAVGQFAYLVALLGWIWTITHRDPVPAPPSAETLARVQEISSDFDVVPKERIFAAVGIKITRPEGEEEPPEEKEQQPSRSQAG